VKRQIEIAGTLTFAALTLVLGLRVARMIDGPGALAVVAAATAAAILVTDFISALVHWFCDTYFEEDTPVLGRALIFPFREHHRDPTAMTHRDTLEINNSNALSVIPFLVAGVVSEPPHSLFAQSWLFAFGLSVYATNTIHKWAHQRNAPGFVQRLQRYGLLLRPDHHRKHHARPSTAYGITTGWLNPVLDRTGFFRHFEALIAFLQRSAARTPHGPERS
jgi:ubiquitin-conjugating enzyme E2 variant